MYLMIDNYDSFVYNLKAYFEELGRDILVRRSDEITAATVKKGARPMHGKVTRVHHRGTGLFAGLPETFDVARCHSLRVREGTLKKKKAVLEALQ